MAKYTPYINIDMDGVLFDFGYQASKVIGKKTIPGQPMPVKHWQMLADYKDFFYEMPLFDGAKEFVQKVVKDHGSRVRFLSTIPSSFVLKSIVEKRRVIRKHFGVYIPFIPVVNSPKWYYLENSGDVLIDDLAKNVDPWSARGGNGILFDGDYDQVYEILKTVRN